MRKKELLEIIPCTLPSEFTDEKVMAKSQLIMLKENEILNIDLFYKGELKARYFADKNKHKYISFINGKWTENAIFNVSRECEGKKVLRGCEYGYYDKNWCYDTVEDEHICESYFSKDGYGNNGFRYNLEYWEEDCRDKKMQNKLDRKKTRINSLMDTVPIVSDDVRQWIKNKVFTDDYLLVDEQKQRTNYSCTACGAKSWQKKTFKHGKVIPCPKCGKSVKTEKKRKIITKKEPVILLQIVDDVTWVERQFQVVCTWVNNEKNLNMYEELRIMIPVNETYGKVYYGEYRNSNEFEQQFWDRNPCNKRCVESYLYPDNLNEVLLFAGLNRSGLDTMAVSGLKFDVNKYILTANKRPWLEYLTKAGLTQLTADIVHQYGWGGAPGSMIQQEHTLSRVLKIDGNRVARMKRLNSGLNILEWLQYEEKAQNEGSHIKISEESLKFLTEKKVEMNSCTEILKELGSVNRMVNYMKKQKISPKTLVTTWRDYLRMAKDEGLDTSDDIIRLPKDLKQRHDDLVEIIGAKNQKKLIQKNQDKYNRLNEQIIKQISMISPYLWENDKYMIIPAARCEELIEEGRKLHHCVGSSEYYMEQMAQGKTWILFMRKKEDLENPYYTIEVDIKRDKIIQWYSEFDRQPDKQAISKVLNQWINTVQKKRNINMIG